MVTEAVNTLLELKAKYKAATGNDWKPGAQKPAAEAKASSPAKKEGSPKKEASPALSGPGAQLNEDIIAQGDKVRALKAEKADKVAIDTAVQVLLGLKAKFKTVTGSDWKPPASGKVFCYLTLMTHWWAWVFPSLFVMVTEVGL